jgi:hypothetical protein
VVLAMAHPPRKARLPRIAPSSVVPIPKRVSDRTCRLKAVAVKVLL